MGIQSLAEAVILNSMEDIFDRRRRFDSLKFFSSDDFNVFAELSGMNLRSRIELLYIVRKLNGRVSKTKKTKKTDMAGRANNSPHALPVPSLSRR
jgi:hypothetical protein